MLEQSESWNAIQIWLINWQTGGSWTQSNLEFNFFFFFDKMMIMETDIYG